MLQIRKTSVHNYTTVVVLYVFQAGIRVTVSVSQYNT